jgi:soluble lytic murein transglycosylase-like protein
MRLTPIRIALGAVALVAVLPTPAPAAVPHTVQPGETLWTIAAANNLYTHALAAYNGLPDDAQVILGATVQVPTVAEALTAVNAAPAAAAPAAAAPAAAAAAPAAAPASTSPAAAQSAAPSALGGYTVRWGDTLGGLAAVARVPLQAIAEMNGLDPQKPLLAGTVIKLPAGSPAPPRAAQPAPAATIVPAAGPQPTQASVNAADIQRIAADHGVSPSLAAAIAWQESGFNNSMVSGANARGVMQIMPGTWDWIQQNLAHGPLNPDSALDNVHAGVMYLGHLLEEAGGDPATATAGYYQGLGSVRSRGLFDDTKQYVANVQALRGRFGGN